MNESESNYSLSGWNALYESTKDDIKTKYDVVALFFHHYLIKQGFECIGLSNKNAVNDEAGADANTSAASSKDNDARMGLPEGWNVGENFQLLYTRLGHTYTVESCKSELCIIFNISTNIQSGRKVQAILFDLNDVVQTKGGVEDMIPSYKRMIDNIHAKVSDVLVTELHQNEVIVQEDRQLPAPTNNSDEEVIFMLQGEEPFADPDPFQEEIIMIPEEEPMNAPNALLGLAPDGFIGFNDPDALLGADPVVLPDAAPDALPDAAPNALPDAAPDALPDAAPDALPGAGPDNLPGAGPDDLPGAGQDRVADGGVIQRLFPRHYPRVDPRAYPRAGIRHDNALANMLLGDHLEEQQRQGGPLGIGLPLRMMFEQRRNEYPFGGRRIGEADLNPLAGQQPNGGMLFDPFQQGPHSYPRMRFDPFGPPGTNDPFGHHFDHDNFF